MWKKFTLGCVLFYSTSIFAGGIFVYEVGSQDLGLASAGWSARAQDAATVFTNPAGMSRLQSPQLMTGLEPIYINARFSPNRKTTVRGTHGNADAWLPAGGFFYVHPTCTRFNFGIASVGYFGSALDWGTHWVGRYHARKNLLQGYSFITAASYRISESLSIGAGLNTMYGVIRQFSSINNRLDGLPDGKLSFKDRRFGFGATAGILYEPQIGTRFGLTYLSKVHLHFKDRPKAHQAGPTLQAVINRLNLSSTHLRVNIETPQTVIASFYREINGRLALMGNVGWQQWSHFGRVEIMIADLNQRSYGISTRYKDTWHGALGAQYRLCDPLLVSFGAAYDSSLLSSKNRPITFPVGEQWRFSTGAAYQWNSKIQFYAGYEFLWSGNLKVKTSQSLLTGTISGKYRNFYSHILDLGINCVF